MRTVRAFLEQLDEHRRAPRLGIARVLEDRLPIDELVGFREEVSARRGRVPQRAVLEREFGLGVEVLGVVDILTVADEQEGHPVAGDDGLSVYSRISRSTSFVTRGIVYKRLGEFSTC